MGESEFRNALHGVTEMKRYIEQHTLSNHPTKFFFDYCPLLSYEFMKQAAIMSVVSPAFASDSSTPFFWLHYPVVIDAVHVFSSILLSHN